MDLPFANWKTELETGVVVFVKQHLYTPMSLECYETKENKLSLLAQCTILLFQFHNYFAWIFLEITVSHIIPEVQTWTFYNAQHLSIRPYGYCSAKHLKDTRLVIVV